MYLTRTIHFQPHLQNVFICIRGDTSFMGGDVILGVVSSPLI